MGTVTAIESRTAHGVANDGIQLDGRWATEATALTLPAGAVVVSGEQRLLRLAAQLLEPTSNDGLFTYEVLGLETSVAGASAECPVFHMLSPPALAASSHL